MSLPRRRFGRMAREARLHQGCWPICRWQVVIATPAAPTVKDIDSVVARLVDP